MPDVSKKAQQSHEDFAEHNWRAQACHANPFLSFDVRFFRTVCHVVIICSMSSRRPSTRRMFVLSTAIKCSEGATLRTTSFLWTFSLSNKLKRARSVLARQAAGCVCWKTNWGVKRLPCWSSRRVQQFSFLFAMSVTWASIDQLYKMLYRLWLYAIGSRSWMILSYVTSSYIQ